MLMVDERCPQQQRAHSQEPKSVQQYSTKLFLDIKLLAVQTSVHKEKKLLWDPFFFSFFSLSYGSSAVVLQVRSDAFREPAAFCWEVSVEAALVAAAQSNLCFFIRTEPGALALVICNTYGKQSVKKGGFFRNSLFFHEDRFAFYFLGRPQKQLTNSSWESYPYRFELAIGEIRDSTLTTSTAAVQYLMPSYSFGSCLKCLALSYWSKGVAVMPSWAQLVDACTEKSGFGRCI